MKNNAMEEVWRWVNEMSVYFDGYCMCTVDEYVIFLGEIIYKRWLKMMEMMTVVAVKSCRWYLGEVEAMGGGVVGIQTAVWF